MTPAVKQALAQLRRWPAAPSAATYPPVAEARRRSLQAVDVAAEALKIDPTLAEPDRCRGIDLLTELLRQLKPLARQAETHLEKQRLEQLPGTERQIARLGRTNPIALEELDALSRRAVDLAQEIRAAALPDWNTPTRIRERSTRLLPGPDRLEDIAEQLRTAARPSASLSHPDPQAVRLTDLADQISAIAAAIDAADAMEENDV